MNATKVDILEKQLKTTLKVLCHAKNHSKELKDKFIKQGGKINNWGQFEYLIDSTIKDGLKLLNMTEDDINY